jgi:hypothetical protein
LRQWCAVAKASNPWAELIAAARAQIRRAEGNPHIAREVLRQAAIALRDVLGIHNPDKDPVEEARRNRGKPDPERREYLLFLLKALEQIDQEVDADKALCLWISNRSPLPDDRNLGLFFAVGLKFDHLTKQGVEEPFKAAIAAVAKRTGLGQPTVEKAWKEHGGKKGWKLARAAQPDSGK